MPVAGMTTPVTADSFKNLQLNAGAFLTNFDWSTYTSATALKTAVLAAFQDETKTLGVTRGGGQFTTTREMRQAEVDGVRYRFVGDTFVDSIDCQLSTTLLELTPGNIKRILGSATVTTTGTVNKITLNTRITDEDYLENLCWIGDLADGRLVLIGFKHALNTADFNITFTDKGEATMPVEFHAFQGDVEDYDTAPVEIIFFDDAP